ncbi:MAG: dihydrolipoyl dehydrogenase [Gammaproteobacteria bacterium]|nr:dihydrolipoyl dehydrogenase [Gammaproteobacteria bacterium]MCY4282033.1 dihydrolipoyl dehydrogenase [Gammaproteobacteria bacterium]MCY4338606.1 dihydrolipoyl dehydrogenase [Gammaproteobacteria bacterium]
MKKYDVVVIGAGPGGYLSAIRCAQLGFSTACVDGELSANGKPTLGGVCLNKGCIPSKALLDSSHHYAFIKNQAAEHGINVSGIRLDIHKMISRKERLVQKLTRGIAGLFKKNGVEWLQGQGQLLEGNQVQVTPDGKHPPDTYQVSAKHIIIATGSAPTKLPVAAIDQNRIVDSTGALAFTEVPKRLGIIGAGVIGLELGSVWSRMGAEVVILEALDEFLAPVDRDIAVAAAKLFEKQGLDIQLGARVTGTGLNNHEVSVAYEQAGEKQKLAFDKLVVAVGRSPNVAGLGAEAVGLALSRRGAIEVDNYCATNLPDVYAIGDVVRGPMLAHKAAEEGIMVAERLAGQDRALNLELVPWVIYTWPEIAWVGKTETELQAAGAKYKTGLFPMAASGRAQAAGDTDGMMKMISAADTDQLLGVHILAPNASELVAEAVLAMEFDGSAEDIARTIHAHPTLSEAMHEAALATDQRALHI